MDLSFPGLSYSYVVRVLRDWRWRQSLCLCRVQCGMVAIASLSGLVLRTNMAARGKISPSFFRGVSIAAFGSSLQITAAPIDFWWHSTYGFDPFLFTPAHSLLIVGMIIGGVGMLIGSIRLLRARRAGEEFPGPPRLVKLVPAIVILGLAAVWAQLNFLG